VRSCDKQFDEHVVGIRLFEMVERAREVALLKKDVSNRIRKIVLWCRAQVGKFQLLCKTEYAG
jgi:hypothetical protein